MFKAVIRGWARRAAFISLLLIGFSTFAQTGTGSVTLSWYPSPSTNVTGYKVYFGLASRTYTTSIDVGNVTNATVTGLLAGTTYYFAVTAYDSAGLESDFSAEVSYTVPALPPAAVTLTAPANGANYLAPASISLAASVTTNSHTINQVQFYNGATLLGTVTTAPYTFAWNNVSAGTYSLSAQVGYDSGSNAVSASVSVTITNLPPPAIALTAPANGANYLAPATLNLAASVTANGNSITSVSFYNGASLLGTSTTAPYTYAWSNVGAGSYSLSAQVVYGSGSTASSATANVTVTNPAPSVALTAPVSGAYYTAPASIGLAASVTANGNSITSVRFYNGANLLGTSTTAPYTYAWNNVGAGNYGLSAQVVYGSGGTQVSGIASVTVTNPPPTIALTAPTNGANYAAPASITLAAGATANGHTINQVQFYNGATLLGTATTAPYTFTWSSVSSGTYALIAQLVYDSGSTLASSSASVTVHALPTISAITNYLMLSNSVSRPIAFTVGDVETDVSNLTLTASSDNTVLIPASNVVFGGSGSNRTATITPSLNHTGYANITITVSYGVASASATFQVTVEGAGSRPLPPTLISVTGNGSVTPDLNGQTLTIGQSYTVTAIPGPGQRFAGWSGSLGSKDPTITFIMSSELSLTANFVPSPYSVTSGTFSGLFYPTNQYPLQPDRSGTFTVVVTTRGSYSGHLQIGSTRYAFSGYLGTNGLASKSISRRANTALNLQLAMGAGTAANQVSGTLSDGNWVANLTGDRAVFDTRTNPARYAGHYTIILPGQGTNSTAPAGNGYGTVRVTAGGVVMFAGKLADGTTISQSANVSQEGTWPLYVSLYTSKGLLAGWLDFTNEANDDLSGQVSWIKPALSNGHYYAGGFASDLTAAGSVYVQPASSANAILSLTNGMITFSGGNLSAEITNSIALGTSSRVTNLSANKLSLGFSLSTGLFTGRVTDPATGDSLPFGGAVFQKLDAAYGFLLGTDQSSDVQIGQ